MALTLPVKTSYIVISAVISIIPTLVGIMSSMMQQTDLMSTSLFTIFKTASEGDTYDFIVVGGGSAGAAVVARLSKDPSASVLLLESGGDPNPMTYIPATAPYILSDTSITFPYATVPQTTSAYGVQNQSILWPRGRSLGGSSNVNFMVYNRGNANDYDRWAQITGDLRWSWKNVEKYFLKLENYFGNWDGNGFHGKNGPLRVEPGRYTRGLRYILEGANEVGFPTRDANAKQTPGISPVDFTQEQGMRFSAYRAYIQPNEHRSNLHILRYSHVSQIHFDNDMRAIGVTYSRHGSKQYARARREVILSAGSIASPQILMLSGIGPADHLQDLGIRPLLNLPVGENLQDHVTTFVGPFLLNKPESFIPERDLNVRSLLSYLKDGKGALSVPFGLAAFAFVPTSSAKPSWSDIFWAISTYGVHRGLPSDMDVAFNTRNNLFQRFLRPNIGTDAHFALQVLGLPQSVGYLRLRDTDPNSLPIIDPRYFTDPNGQDINAVIEGMEMLVHMYENTTSLGGQLGARLSKQKVPGCERFTLRTRGYWECVARTLTATLYHPAGTCAMGKTNSGQAVVDSQLRVIGTKGLRVADCSIMPKLINSNNNAAAMMIGEMCGDLIKRTWGLR